MVFKNSYFNIRINPITHYSPWCIAIVGIKYFLIYIAMKKLAGIIAMYNSIMMSGNGTFGHFSIGFLFVIIFSICSIFLIIDLCIFFKDLFIAYKAYFKLPVLSIGYKQGKTFLSNFDTKEFEVGKVYISNNSYKGNGYYNVTTYFGFVVSNKIESSCGYQWNQELIKGTFLNTIILYSSWLVSDWISLFEALGEKTGIYCISKKEKKEKFKKDALENSQSSLEQLMKKIDKIKNQSQGEIEKANGMMKDITQNIIRR